MKRFRDLLFPVFIMTMSIAVACGDADDSSFPRGAADASGEDSASDSLGSTNSASSESADSAISQRKIIVTSGITLRVTGLRSAYQSVEQLAKQAGGFVADAQISETADDSNAFLRLRVPAIRHDGVI